jgi:PqqD family protein of HPr-rel-A system
MLVRVAHATVKERRFGDESVVFDGYSGETHYLDGLAGMLMRRVLQSSPVDLARLRAEFAGSPLPDHGGTVTPGAVDDTAAMLQRLGLLRLDPEA